MPITGTELDTISTNVSAGSGDHGKIVLLDSTGKIDSSMLPTFGSGTVDSVTGGTGIDVTGTTNVTVAAIFGTSSSTICVGNDGRLSDDRTASGIRTATTVVALSTATAPSAGQVLAAIDSSSAHWVAPTAGADGTKWYWYSSDEVLPVGEGNPGDLAIIVAGPSGNGNIYQNIGGSWTAIGNIRGTDGTAGTVIRSGTTAPVDGTGADGDFYLRTDTGQFYKRVSGTYTLVLTMQLSLTYSTGLNLTSGTLTVVYGTTSGTACQGNDSRLSDSRTPTGTAGGDLAGTYPNPTVAKIHETSGPTALTIGAINDGEFLKRSGSNIISAAGAASTTVENGGTTVGTRGAINLIAGSNVTLTTTDNSGSDRIDVTIASTGGGGGSGTHDPFLDAPTSGNSDDDEFTSDTILSGTWTIEDSSNTVLTRSGNVDPWTLPSSGNYRSTVIGSTLLIQTPAAVDVRIHKTITSIGTNEFLHGRIGYTCTYSSTSSNDMLVYFGMCANSSGHTDLTNAVYMGSLSPGGSQIVRASSVSGNTPTSVDSAQSVQSQVSAPIWGIRKASTSYTFMTCDLSGQMQRYQGPITNTATMARFFIRTIMQSNATMPGCLVLHFMRRQSSSTAWFAQS